MQLLSYTALHYINYIILRYNCNYHYIALHNATLQLYLHDNTLGYTILYYPTIYNNTIHYNTLRYLHHKLQLQLHYTNYTR